MPSIWENRLGAPFAAKPKFRIPPEANASEAGALAQQLRTLVRRKIDDVLEVEAVETGQTQIGSLQATHYEFRRNTQVAFTGTLLTPTEQSPRGHILILPGQNAHHDQVIGAVEPDWPERNAAERLSLAGFHTLTIDFGFADLFSTEKNNRDQTSILAHLMELQGRSLLACLAADTVAALHWLESIIDNNGKLGLFGQSLGGQIALHAALAYPDPLTVVLASCIGSYQSIFQKNKSAGGAHALPDILRSADLPDLVSALAPGWLQIQHGRNDHIFPFSEAESVAADIASAYKLQDASDKLEISFLNMGHAFDAKYAAAFFSRVFSQAEPVPPRIVPPVRISLDGNNRRLALDEIDNALFTGQLTLGPVGEAFEQMVSPWVGGRETVAVNSGTSAIEVALRIIGVKDKTVAIPANTFFATASAAMAAGADVEFIDTEADGLGMDPKALKALLKTNKSIGAVIVVHIGGIISPHLPEIAQMCEKHGVDLIEDAAHALGSEMNGRPAGSFGRLASFSFYPTKVATCGEGGIICTKSKEDAYTAKLLRDHGKLNFTSNVHGHIGSNWRLSEVHAAVGKASMAQLPDAITDRRNAARFYDAQTKDLSFACPILEPQGVQSNYYKYMLMLRPDIDRVRLKAHLKEQFGVIISGEIYDPLCCAQPALHGRFDLNDFPVAVDFSSRHICLPIFPGITQQQLDHVASALHAINPSDFIKEPDNNTAGETNASV